MSLAGKKIGILMESDFYEDEIFYYKHRFPEEGLETHFLTRLWGQERITFHGHEYKVPFEVSESFEDMSDEELRSYAAIIVPSAIVSDRLRYTEDVNTLPPATQFLARAFAEKDIIKGIICHGLWLVAPMPELVRGRPVVAHNNLHGDVVNMGAIYTDEDVVTDVDLVTGRTGGHCHQFARAIIDLLLEREASAPQARRRARLIGPMAVHHMGLVCRDPVATERFYTRYFGFRRARVVPLGDGEQIVFLKSATLPRALQGDEGEPGTGGRGSWARVPGLATPGRQGRRRRRDARRRRGRGPHHRRPDELRRLHPGLAGRLDRRSGRQHRRDRQGYVDQEHPPEG